MRKGKFLLIAITFGLSGMNLVHAEKNLGTAEKPKKVLSPLAANCAAPTSKVELDINNVRTTLLNGGDFWWDLSGAKYEIPKIADADRDKVPSKHALFSGNIWLGGLDGAKNILVAAHTYRQGSQINFWPGPLKDTSGGIEQNECALYDKHYKVNQSDVDAFISNLDPNGLPLPGYVPPSSITDWPGNINLPGRKGVYAPFFDRSNDGIYSPQDGDYPIYGYDATNTQIIKPDQFIWWVQNDAGNTKTGAASKSIYLEIQSTAFAFVTSNSLNNTTFYRHVIVNRSSNISLDSTYFGINVDADLGYAFDDYVGCDVGKSLGICYNGDDDDDAAFGGYGLNPPSVGVDFFKGPKDENGNILPLAKFMYYNNNTSVTGNPNNASDYYNYLRGIWRDNKRVTYGGNGYNASSTDYADFMFPGSTDPKKRRLWTERTESNAPFDRRFVESAGPFKFIPGARNEIVVGVVWARANSGGSTGSFNNLLIADNQAQDLFNKDFLLEDGPRTPDMNITELDRKLVISLTNTKECEAYSKLVKDRDQKTFTYNFEGYKIYQLKNGQVSASELGNEDKAKLVAIYDIKNNVIRALNVEYDPSSDQDIPVLKVESPDQGIKHVLEVDLDLFNSSTPIVNHRVYYFTLVAYAYNETSSEQYLQGRLNVRTYAGIPHKNTNQYGGSSANSTFNDGPKITRLQGSGNGGNFLDLTAESRDAIMSAPGFSKVNLTYKNARGPVTVRVIEPNKIPKHKFVLDVNAGLNSWTLTDSNTNEVFVSDVTNGLTDYEQVIAKYGFSVKVFSTKAPGTNFVEDKENGLIQAEIEYKDPKNPWFKQLVNCKGGVSRDPNAPSGLNCNWIVNSAQNVSPASKYDPANDFDPLNVWLNVLGGRFAAMYQVRDGGLFGPSPLKSANSDFPSTPNVDLVLTDDQSKWSECVVVEVEDGAVVNTEGGQIKGNMRDASTPQYGRGKSIFPGYAIDVNTGKRLNVFFGEGSSKTEANGRDMLFNPTLDTIGATANVIANGGKHYIYIHNSEYDKCNAIWKLLDSNGYKNRQNAIRAQVYNKVAWVTIPLTDPKTFNEDLKNTCIVKLRAKQPYQPYPTASDAPKYTFDMSDLASTKNDGEALKKSMDLIGVVPNPYYAFSENETGELDSRVRIINVPGSCSVTIYSTSGVLIRKLTKSDDAVTSIDWDLRNANGVPVASGIYLFNIRTFIDGKPYDKVVKWFGVNRQIDLNTF